MSRVSRRGRQLVGARRPAARERAHLGQPLRPVVKRGSVVYPPSSSCSPAGTGPRRTPRSAAGLAKSARCRPPGAARGRCPSMNAWSAAGCGREQPDRMHGDHALLDHAPPAEEVAPVVPMVSQLSEVAMEEGQPHPFLLDGADREHAEVQPGRVKTVWGRRRHVRAVRGERPHVFHREAIRQVVAAPAHHVEGMGGVHPLGRPSDLETTRSVPPRSAGRACAGSGSRSGCGDEVPGGGRSDFSGSPAKLS